MAPKSTPISATKEDYIRMIYRISQNGTDVGVTQLAHRLDLSKSTVSERLKELDRDGYVNASPYACIVLTAKGLLVAEKLTYKHRIVEVFLHSVLGLPKNKVHEEAEKLEHACSDEVIKRLAHFLEHPTNDPHGSEIPKIKNWN